MAETVYAHAVDLKIVGRNALTVGADLRLVLGLKDRIIRASRAWRIRQTGGVSVWASSGIAKNSGRQPDQFVRITTGLRQSLDLGGRDSFCDVRVLSFELCSCFVGDRDRRSDLADLENYVDALNIFSADGHVLREALLVTSLLDGQFIFAWSEAQ